MVNCNHCYFPSFFGLFFQVKKVNFKAGETVNEGDVILEFE